MRRNVRSSRCASLCAASRRASGARAARGMALRGGVDLNGRVGLEALDSLETPESIERGVSVCGQVRFAWEGDCRRCLEVTEGEFEIEIVEIFQVDAPEDSELLDLQGAQIDLVPIVRDAVVLSLPLAPLCRDDCAGPDPDRYPARTEVDLENEAAAERIPDPRWAALDELKLDES